MSDEEPTKDELDFDRVLYAIGGPATGRPLATGRKFDVLFVELCAIECRIGKRPSAFLKRPAHIPEGDAEAYSLFTSSASKDQFLKNDLHEWSSLNRNVVVESARNLKTIVAAYQSAERLLNDDPGSDEEQSKINALRIELQEYLLKVWDVDARTIEGDIEAWTLSTMAKRSPVPTWLTARKPPDASSRRFFHAAPKKFTDVMPVKGTTPKGREIDDEDD